MSKAVKYKEDTWQIDLKNHYYYIDKHNTDLFITEWEYQNSVGQLMDRLLDLSFTIRTMTKGKRGCVGVEKHTSPFYYACPTCCEEVDFTVDWENKTFKADNPCPTPNGYPEYFVEVDVPSGQLLFGNDFRKAFPRLERKDREASGSVNFASGRKRVSELYAEGGMIHIHVSNTCPGVYKKDNRLVIGNVADRPKNLNIGRKAGRITTDLWWYSAADKSLIKPEVADTFPDSFIVKVTPGRYRASGRSHLVERSRKDLLHSQMFALESALGDIKKEVPLEKRSDYLGISELSQKYSVKELTEMLAWTKKEDKKEKEDFVCYSVIEPAK